MARATLGLGFGSIGVSSEGLFSTSCILADGFVRREMHSGIRHTRRNIVNMKTYR